MRAIHVRTPGLMCEECTGKIQAAVGDLPGVISVTAPHESGTTSVMFDEAAASSDAILHAIHAAGFEVEAG
ncbi:MAG: heavy-metal-associated domain-containing protein [Coriobacteriia bacterium]